MRSSHRCQSGSPVLFGRRLWAETRIALFEQACDIRTPGHHLRDSIPRVSFGSQWLKGSVVDLYKEIGFREEQLEALGQSRALGSPILMVWTAALGAACVAYTIWLRKYFVKGHRERGR